MLAIQIFPPSTTPAHHDWQWVRHTDFSVQQLQAPNLVGNSRLGPGPPSLLIRLWSEHVWGSL
jgi:hypothetical protein